MQHNPSTPLRNRINTVVRDIPRSGIRDFFDIVSTMKDVISLGIGEPDFDTPWHVRESTVFALERGATHYTSNLGYLELRKALSKYVSKNFGAEYNPEDEILVTVGVSEALDLALRALINPGDEVLYHEPCYVSYRATILVRGRQTARRRDQSGEWFSPHPRDARSQMHAQDEGLDAEFPEQSHRRRHEPGGLGETSPSLPSSATSSSSRTRSTPN